MVSGLESTITKGGLEIRKIGNIRYLLYLLSFEP